MKNSYLTQKPFNVVAFSFRYSLYKWGGTYLDLDVIVKKSFDNIEPNYAGAESLNTVAAGLINVDYKDEGHEVAERCLK